MSVSKTLVSAATAFAVVIGGGFAIAQTTGTTPNQPMDQTTPGVTGTPGTPGTTGAPGTPGATGTTGMNGMPGTTGRPMGARADRN